MPPPRSEKKKKALEEKLRKEKEALEKRIELYRQSKKLNFIRLALLKENYKIFDGSSRGLAKLFAVKDQKNSWNRYISCTKFPLAHQPPALRSFISTWKIQIEEDLEKYFDWMLNADERTILSQKIDRNDLTVGNLRSKQPNFAEPFAKRANDAITVLTDIEDVLNRPEHYQCTEKCINELLQIKDDFRSYLWKTLDIMSYTTIGNIERDMIAIDATSAAYQFKSSVFAIGLYSNREVPQPRMEDRADILSIRFDSISATIKCPKHITFDESALRGLWFSYDHYSDQARSYKIPNYIPSVESLLESCRLETEDKEHLENDNIERMKRDRAKYEETIVEDKPQSNEEEKKTKPKRGRGRRGEVSVKIVEPPIVDEDTVIDVTAEYMELENHRNQERLKLLHPDELQLQSNELNLRKYNTLGGIYAIHYLERPAQSVKFDNHMFLRNIEKPAELKYRPYKQYYRPVEFPSDCVLSALDQEDIKRKDIIRFNQLIEVSVQLASDIFWWEEPVVCRWQPWEESDAFMKLPDDLRDYNLNYDKIIETKSTRLWNVKQNKKVSYEPAVLEDFDLNGSRNDVHLDYLIRKHLLPRLSVTYRFESELKEVEEKLASEMRRRLHLQREHEEDLRLEAAEREEAKKLKDEQRAARRAERTAKLLEQQVNEEEFEIEEIFVSSSSSSEIALVDENFTENSVPNGDGLITFKTVVEGTAARELFPFLEKCTELKIIRPKRSEFRWSLLNVVLSTKVDVDMLSGLLERIQQYNLNEQPQFLAEVPAMSAFETIGNAIIEPKTSATKRKGKRGTVAAQQSTVKHQSEELKLVPHNKGDWITSGIFLQNFDPVERIVTFKTSEIGVFGFAVSKYYQFPISYWEVRPNLEKSMTTVVVVTGRTVSIEILVSVNGYRLTITKPTPKKCPIKVPTTTMSLKQLIQFLREHNMNFFPEPDAFWYINENIEVKHDAMCNHTYLCIGHFCQTHQFRRSAWNVHADRRVAILLSRQIIENRAAEQFVEVKITPHDAYFVHVEELCTSLDQVSLFYHLAPPDQEFNCDVFSLLTAQSVDKSKKKQENTSIRLKSNVSELLMALQLLSYST